MKKLLQYLVIPAALVVVYVMGGSWLTAMGIQSVKATLYMDMVILCMSGMYYLTARPDMAVHKKAGLNLFVIVLLLPFFWLITQIGASLLVQAFPSRMEARQLSHSEEEALYTFLTTFVAPIAEEFLFRGVMFLNIRRLWGRPLAYAVNVLVFAALHGAIPSIYVAMVCGALFTAVYDRCGKLWYGIVIHMLYNMCTIVLNRLPLPSVLFHPAVATVLNVACCVGVVLYIMKMHAFREIFEDKEGAVPVMTNGTRDVIAETGPERIDPSLVEEEDFEE